jgi:hypothetical protein
MARRELPGRKRALGGKRFRERFVRCVKTLGWCVLGDESAGGIKLFVLRGVYQRHIRF